MKRLRWLVRPGLSLVLALLGGDAGAAETGPRPNILWITSEDNGPHLGCYGDGFARTPNLDRLAGRGMIYRNCWSTAPVCAPARTAIISGLYPSATGSEHMRSLTRLAPEMRMYPQYLREAGYYCSNNSKEDYNLAKPGKVWDESSPRAHWKNRKAGQPFFAIFNHTVTHESQIRRRPHTWRHDPARVRVPAYHPDTPEVRQDWAQYYDQITEMDALAGQNLRELEEAGLAEDTIIFYYGDHGPGLPRNKRWPYNSGLHVPLIVHVPEKFRHLAPPDYRAGGVTDRLASFVDLAPTVLSLAGIRPPEHLHGRAFMGEHAAAAPDYLHGLRGRMDERYDLVRSVRDRRYVYIRNYMPHRIYGQYLDYMFQTPTTRIWRQLYDQGKLAPPRTFFWETKPPEELYDLQSDPDEVNNLAGSPAHAGILERLRRVQQEHALRVRDLGFLPEGEIHSRAGDRAPIEMGRNEHEVPLRRIIEAADLAAALKPEALPRLRALLRDADSAVRFWAAQGILMRGQEAVPASAADLRRALNDGSPYVRVTAAEALARYGEPGDLEAALARLIELGRLEKNNLYVVLYALNAIDILGKKAVPLETALRQLPQSHPSIEGRMNGYVPRLLERIIERLPPEKD